MNYRPITDVWILARPKVAYYGAYPAGFLERARAMLGVTIYDPVLHVCGGMVRAYPLYGFGPNDKTLDLDPALNPDYLQSAADPYPEYARLITETTGESRLEVGWPAILADRPYTDEDHAHYAPGQQGVPLVPANVILRRSLAAIRDGGRVGILDYVVPQPPPTGCKFVAKIAVWCGYNNRERAFSTWEKRP